MNDLPVEHRRGEFLVSTDRGRLDLGAALALLRTTHWAGGLPAEVLAKAAANSLCFGLYDLGDGARLVGFARAVTDLATYAYLADVVVAESHRGRGLGRWLVECILAHPELQELRRIALFTRDAQALYTRFGFGPPLAERTYLEIRGPLGRRVIPDA